MRIERIAEDKRRFLPLLLIADPDEGMIGRYLDRGDLFALYDSGELKSVCVVTAESETVCELKNLATEETARNRGYATALIRHVLDVYRDRFSVMQVGTGDFPKTLRFYEQCGFVFSHRVAGFFYRPLSGTRFRGRRALDRYGLPETGAVTANAFPLPQIKCPCRNVW